MKNTAIPVLATLRFLLPPIISGILLWLLAVDSWPLVHFAIFLGYYNALLYGTYPMVYTARIPPISPWYMVPLLLLLSFAAMRWLGIVGEVLATGLLLMLMADFHERHMLHFGATPVTIVRDSAIFAVIMLVVLTVFFGFSFYMVIACFLYCAHLVHEAKKVFATLPKLRRFS